MTRRRRRDDHLDNRINQTAVDLFRLARKMLKEGVADNSQEFLEVSRGIDRELQLRPWQPCVLDFELFIMKPSSFPPHAGFRVVEELHRRLVAAAGG
jgi:hypothetical protein